MDRLAQIIRTCGEQTHNVSPEAFADAIVDSGFLFELEDEAYIRGYNAACDAEGGGR